jgi:hypothetical protein
VISRGGPNANVHRRRRWEAKIVPAEADDKRRPESTDRRSLAQASRTPGRSGTAQFDLLLAATITGR